MKHWIAAAATAAMTLAVGQALARGPAIETRLTYLTACRETDHGKDAEDWVSYRCRGIGSASVWRVYHEGTRMQLGFGSKQNYSGMYAADRDNKWPIEWRLQAGKPFAAIVRVKHADETPGSSLVVYRLRNDGMSCIIGEADDNTKARAIADAAVAGYKCGDEPYTPS